LRALLAATQHASGAHTRETAILHRYVAVHQHPRDTDRIRVRRLEGRAVLHGFRVEYHDIRPHSLGETAAIVQPESCGRLRGHLVYRLRQGEDAALANVP